jgi:uncharacterized protein (TIGR02246 family)
MDRSVGVRPFNKETDMNRFVAAALSLILLQSIGTAWAGPVEDVTQIAAARGQAFQDGNVEAYVAAFADNATFLSSFSPYRIEGKEAIKAYFTELFLMYPRRHLFIRQAMARAYNDDLVIQNGYAVLNTLNERGEPKTLDTRYSLVWSKIGGKWQIVDQHVSLLPAAR